ncbi:MAG: molybdopterin molybdotransferase MoeA, partial [Thermoprotei archaeon]
MIQKTGRMHPVGSLTALGDAVALIDELKVTPLPPVRTDLIHALGKVSYSQYANAKPVPRFPRATFDGYALRSSDTVNASSINPVSLKVIGVSKPGSPFLGNVGPLEAVEILTGGLVPNGADAVVMVEKTLKNHRKLLVSEPVNPGACMDPVGADIETDHIIIRAGEQIGLGHVMALASQGVVSIAIAPSPKVLLVPTGDEIKEPGSRLSGSQIYDSNTPALTSLLEKWGCRVYLHKPLRDRPELFEGLLRKASRYDLVVFTGGSSAGSEDYLEESVAKVGRVLVHGVAINPGRPTLVGMAAGVPVVGVPGHPSSSMAVGYMVLKPVLERIIGFRIPETVLELSLGVDVELDRHMTYFRPAKLVDGHVYPTYRGSSMISSFLGAQGY